MGELGLEAVMKLFTCGLLVFWATQTFWLLKNSFDIFEEFLISKNLKFKQIFLENLQFSSVTQLCPILWTP